MHSIEVRVALIGHGGIPTLLQRRNEEMFHHHYLDWEPSTVLCHCNAHTAKLSASGQA